MKRYYYKGEDITYSQFKINDISYPSNWCQIIDDIEVLKLGIILIDDEAPIINNDIEQEVDPNYIPINIFDPNYIANQNNI